MFHASIDARQAIHTAWCGCGECTHASPAPRAARTPPTPPAPMTVYLQAAVLLAAAAAFAVIVAVSFSGILAAFGLAR